MVVVGPDELLLLLAATATPAPTATIPPTISRTLPPPPFFFGVAAAEPVVPAFDPALAGVAVAAASLRASSLAASKASMILGGNLSGESDRSLIWPIASRNLARAAASWPLPHIGDAQVQVGLGEVFDLLLVGRETPRRAVERQDRGRHSRPHRRGRPPS